MVMPIAFAKKALFRSILNRYVAILPAYTPVPGIGNITKNSKPKNPYFFILSAEPFFALLAIHKASFLYRCHLNKRLLTVSKKNIINGKTKIFEITAITNTK